MDKFFSIEAMPLGNGVEKVAVFLNEQSDDIFPPTRVVVEHVPREKLIDIIRGMTQWINIRFEICEDCLREHFSNVAPISCRECEKIPCVDAIALVGLGPKKITLILRPMDSPPDER